MKAFKYHQPTEILFGRGRIAEAGAVTARFGRRCLLVTVREFPGSAALFDRVGRSLAAAGLAVEHFDGVLPNPTTEVVAAGTELALRHEADVVLGLGGGSSMDTAKAIAVEAAHDGSAWDYLFFRPRQPSERTLPVVAVTTTSGTGSHVTQVAVITNAAERNKSALYHPRLFPKAAIVDPELVLTAPPRVTAATGFDVFAHAFESYINPNGSPYTDLLALEAIRIVAARLPQAVRDGADIGARTAMAWADTLAGLAIANAGVTLPHGIGMAMSGLFPRVAHGEALAAVYPAIMRFSHDAAPARFAAVARIFDPTLDGRDDAAAAAAACGLLDGFLDAIGLTTTLEDLGISREELAELARASLVLPDYRSHPRVVTADQVLDLLERSCRPKGK